MLPLVKPWFLSDRHYDFLKTYFRGDREYTSRWMGQYYGGAALLKELAGTYPLTEEEREAALAEKEEMNGEEGTDKQNEAVISTSKVRIIQYYNEFVLATQVRRSLRVLSLHIAPPPLPYSTFPGHMTHHPSKICFSVPAAVHRRWNTLQ
jgi:hypothetical protein